MAIVAKDRVKETTTTAGTGTLDLAGAVTAFQGFVSAVGSGNECYYTILDANGIGWEVGAGTVTDASPDTLSRTTILDVSSGASLPWSQIGDDIDGEADSDKSGRSVSLSSDGSIVAIGAPENGPGANTDGHVRVYEYSGGSWSQKGADIDGEGTDDLSGMDVSLSSDGSIVAIGAIYNDGGGSNAGHVRVYEYNSDTSSWDQKGDDIDGDAINDESGESVALSSDGLTVAIGSIRDDSFTTDAGSVKVYEWNNGTSAWDQKGATIFGSATIDYSGYSVSLSDDGSIVAIGAVNHGGGGSNAGQVRVYEYNSGTSAWDQKGADIDGEATGDYSGYSVSLSDDGTVVAIGAYGHDSNKGHVRVYKFGTPDGGNWNQIGTDIDGEATSDQHGESVSLSSDGKIVAIGAPRRGADKGYVRIYNLEPSRLDLSTGTHTVFLTYPAEKSVYRNADNQIVARPHGIIFTDETVQTTAAPNEGGTGLTLHGRRMDANVSTAMQITSPNTVTTTAGKTYSVQVDDSDNLVVNVPWSGGGGGGGGGGGTYTAGTGLALSGTEFYTANTGNFQQLTFNGGIVRIGTNAGFGAVVCTGSEFIGSGAGYRASDIQISQFFGSEAGYQATGIESSQFFGPKAGYQAKDNSYTVAVGSSAGAETSGVTSSVFLGHNAGSGTKDGQYTSAIGYNAGVGVTGNTHGYNQFLGYGAGYQSSKISNVSAIGTHAGREMFISNGEYFGNRAGEYSVYSTQTVAIGIQAGASTSGVTSSVILGQGAGRFSRNVYHSNLIGTNAGVSLSGHSRYELATHNNIIGANAGSRAVGSYNNYIGDYAGNNASGDYNLEINCGGANKIRGSVSGKIHIHDVIIGDSTDGRLAVGSIGTGNLYPDASLEIVSANVNDTGLLVHNLIAAQTGILLPHAVPAVTTNKLYNSSGTLHFDGYPIGSGDSGNFPLTDITVFQGGSGTVPLTIQSWSSPGTLDQAIVNTALIECKDSGGDQSIWRVDQEGDIWMGQSGLTANIITNSGTNNFNIRHTQANKDFNLDYPASNGDFKLRTNDGLDPRTIVDRVVWDSDGNSTHYGSVRVSGALTSEAVPASDTPTTEDATVALDLSTGNYHNIVLGDSVSEFQFINAKRGQRFLLRITQNAVSAKTVSWSTVYSDAGTTAATLKWAGNITPTMSTTVSNTDVYGFLCTNNTGTIRFDGFIIGQDLPA